MIVTKAAILERLRRIAGARPLVLGCLVVACHGAGPAQRAPAQAAPVKPVPVKHVGPGQVVRDTAGVVDFFKDTGHVVIPPEGQTLTLETPGQRDSLRATLRRERALWRAGGPPDYRFLLRAGCFCPGARGWLLIEVRRGQPLRAWDRAGRPAPLSDWDTYSIDGLFDYLDRSADRVAQVRVSFDPRWHFPAYVYTSALPGPDMWAVIEARGLRPL